MLVPLKIQVQPGHLVQVPPSLEALPYYNQLPGHVFICTIFLFLVSLALGAGGSCFSINSSNSLCAISSVGHDLAACPTLNVLCLLLDILDPDTMEAAHHPCVLLPATETPVHAP